MEKSYMIDGGNDYTRCSVNGDEKFIQVYSDEPYEKVRKYVYRTGWGNPNTPEYGKKFICTFFDKMSDSHLKASIEYCKKRGQDQSEHFRLLLEEVKYREKNNIKIEE